LLLERSEVGGLLREAHLVENYPGFPGGIPGPHLVELFARQLEEVGVQTCLEAVLHVTHGRQGFTLHTSSAKHSSDVLVVATGTKPKALPGLIVDQAARERVLHETHSVRDVRSRRIAIIGAGDAAFDYALNLSQGNEVVILSRSERGRSLPLLEERCLASSRITWRRATVVEAVDREDGGLLLRTRPAGGSDEETLRADYLLIAAGREPCIDVLGTKLREDLSDLVRRGRMHLVGDVANGPYRQTAIAVGDGVRAAMSVVKSLHG
jgi:thioredoxin reductase